MISFGIFDVDRELARRRCAASAEDEAKRREEIAKHVQDIPLEGVYEVVEEIRPCAPSTAHPILLM